MMQLLHHLRRFARAKDGAAAMEFAIVAPVFLMCLMGMIDSGQMIYGKAILNGAVQKASRGSALETANTTAADTMVRNSVDTVMPNVVITSTRRSYYDFADVGRQEQFNDANANGTCDNHESYTDENGSTHWENDVGVAGNGGANDVVMYTVTARFTPLLHLPFLPAFNQQKTLTATAVKKNQPFADQAEYGSTAGTC